MNSISTDTESLFNSFFKPGNGPVCSRYIIPAPRSEFTNRSEVLPYFLTFQIEGNMRDIPNVLLFLLVVFLFI